MDKRKLDLLIKQNTIRPTSHQCAVVFIYEKEENKKSGNSLKSH
jgi:hypothetical protein